ncbi:MAG: phage tail sheath family protein, partial [bacterium]
ESDYRRAFALLDPILDINLVAVPGMGSPYMVSFGADYCQKRGDCFFIGDMSLSDNTPKKAQIFIDNIEIKSSYAAVYFPWLKIKDPNGGSSRPITVPPSGSIAGIYARSDVRRGVWKAPAGRESNINGAVGLLANISDDEQNTLNSIGVNVIRDFPNIGIIVWGSRTLATQSDLEYRYVPVRRTAIFLEQSISGGIDWAVFEPNDASLWAKLRHLISTFMMHLFRAGALCGNTADEAFFVKCDSETTTEVDIAAGVVNILIGFAPLKPGEFSLLKLSQKAGQSAIS